MPSKKKQPTESHLAETALTPPEPSAASMAVDILPVEPETPSFPPAIETAWKWPESTERRPLLVKFTEHDRSEIAGTLSREIAQRDAIEDEKKASASHFKSVLDAIDERLSALAGSIRANGELRDVQCKWFFEVSGIDVERQWIANPDYKCLVRMDTGEVVAAVRITEQDRQANLELPLNDGPPNEELEAQLLAAGLRVDEDAAAEHPFILVDITTGENSFIEGVDNRRAALLKAVADGTVAEEDEDVSFVLDDSVSDTSEDDSILDAIREDGKSARASGAGRHLAPYDAGTPELQAWKEGWDTQDDLTRLATADA